MPVRKIPKRSGRMSGRYPSLKLQRMVSFEAMIERDFICLLDYAPAVTHFEEQPLTVHYEEDGKMRRYTPDFHAVEGDCHYLVECKSSLYVDREENWPKYEAARQWCAANGYKFLIVTDETLRASGFMPNVELLTGYGRFHIDNWLQTQLKTFLLTRQRPTALSELRQSLPDWSEQDVRAAALYLVYHQVIYLRQPLNGLALTQGDLLLTVTPGEQPLILQGVEHNGRL